MKKLSFLLSLLTLFLSACVSQSQSLKATLPVADIISPPPAQFTFTPQPTATSQPKKLQLIDGTLDTCLLLTSDDVENVLSVKVHAEPTAIKGATACKYVTSGGEQQTVLMVTAYTDKTLQKSEMKWDAITWFEQTKKMNSEMSFIKMTDVPDLGEHAYSRQGSLDEVHILKNNVYYIFNSREKEVGGFMSLQTLIELAKNAMRHSP